MDGGSCPLKLLEDRSLVKQKLQNSVAENIEEKRKGERF